MFLVVTRCVAKIEVVYLTPAVYLPFSILFCVRQCREIRGEFWGSEILGVVIAVILEMLWDLCLQKERQDGSMLSVDDAGNLVGVVDEYIGWREVRMTHCR